MFLYVAKFRLNFYGYAPSKSIECENTLTKLWEDHKVKIDQNSGLIAKEVIWQKHCRFLK